MKSIIFPGSFDPITLGHIDLIKRASNIFDKVIVLVANNSNKKYLLNIDERYELVHDVVNSLGLSNVSTDQYNGFIVDYANINSVNCILRGVRAFHDFELEFELYLINKQINANIDTIFLPSTSENLAIRSSFIKELIKKRDFDLSKFIPEIVLNKLKNKFIDKLE